MTLESDLLVAEDAARLAGDLIRSKWGGVLDIQHKGEVDLVTEVDLGAEALIVQRLRASFPGDAIVAEEGSGACLGAGRIWYVDPIDGTTNFAHGFPHFCVSIGLWDALGPRVSVVHAPVFDFTFRAARGQGATLNGRPIRVSEARLVDQALLATGFPYDRRTNPDNNVHRFAHMLRRCQGIRRAGSAALDLASVAAGWFDGYWEDRLKPWDAAAGVLLVLEAGGTVTGLDGCPFDLQSGQAVASNGHLHVELCRALAQARALVEVDPT